MNLRVPRTTGAPKIQLQYRACRRKPRQGVDHCGRGRWRFLVQEAVCLLLTWIQIWWDQHVFVLSPQHFKAVSLYFEKYPCCHNNRNQVYQEKHIAPPLNTLYNCILKTSEILRIVKWNMHLASSTHCSPWSPTEHFVSFAFCIPHCPIKKNNHYSERKTIDMARFTLTHYPLL